MMCRAPDHVCTDYVAIPPEIRERMGPIELTADLFFVNNIPFLLTLGKRIKFTTLENVGNRKGTTLLCGMTAGPKFYGEHVYDISTMFMENDFEALALYMKGVKINLNTTAADEHVPEIERQIRVVKERTRSVWNNLKFDHLLNVMIVELTRKVVMWFNALHVAGGVSGTYSPQSIMTGTTFDFTKHIRIEFGAYVETHKSPQPTNTMDTQTMP